MTKGNNHIQHPDGYVPADEPADELMLHECEEALFRLSHPTPSVDKEWKAMEERMAVGSGKKHSVYRLWTIGLVATAAILGAVFFISRLDNPVSVTTDGGKNMAVLAECDAESDAAPVIEETCADSETKVLPLPKKASVRTQEGMILSRDKADYTLVAANAVRQNVVSIPRGNVYKIILNDGTEVWLNASSRLSFPTRFTGVQREVTLDGEAYFRVSPDKQHPFVIHTEKMSTEVLGTEFNVKAYHDSDASVTLVQGSVKVSLPEMDDSVVLRPGDNLMCGADNYSVQQVDISYYTQWMEGYFYYDDVSLTDILKDLGRWYNVTIAMEQDSFLLSQRLHFVADRNEDIDQALKNLNGYSYLSAIKEGNKVVVCRKRNP